MSLEDLKRDIRHRKDMKDIKYKLGILSKLESQFKELIHGVNSIRDGQTSEVTVKNFPPQISEVQVSNFPEQRESVKISGDVSIKQPRWFSFKGIEKSIKTLSERIEKTVFKVDLDKYQKGTEAIAVKLVDNDGKIYVANSKGGSYPSFGSVNVKDTSNSDVNPATREKQDEIVTALGEVEVMALATTISTLGNNTIVSITNNPRLYYISLSADGANGSDVIATVKIGSNVKYIESLKPGVIWARNIGSGNKYIGGSPGDDIVVNLSSAQTVHVSVEYDDTN